jgi:hypothetical protein
MIFGQRKPLIVPEFHENKGIFSRIESLSGRNAKGCMKYN